MIGSTIGGKKTLWQKQGKAITTIVVLGIIIYSIVAINNYRQSNNMIDASKLYDAIVNAAQKQDKAEVNDISNTLMEKYAKTPYASLAALISAKVALEDNNLEVAKQKLRFASFGEKNGPLQIIARERLARVVISEKQYEEALKILSEPKVPQEYVTLFEEIKGDIYALQQDKRKAFDAYQTAIKAAPQGMSTVRIQMKTADLGVEKEVS